MHWRGTAPSSYSRSRKFRLRPSTNVVGRSEHSRHMFGPELVRRSKPRSLPRSPKLECASEFPYGSTPSHQTKPIASDQFTFERLAGARAVVVQRCNGHNPRLARHTPHEGRRCFRAQSCWMIDARQCQRLASILAAGTFGQGRRAAPPDRPQASPRNRQRGVLGAVSRD